MHFFRTVGSDMPNEEIVVIRPAFPSIPATACLKTQNNINNGNGSGINAINNNNNSNSSFELLDKCTTTLHMVKNVLVTIQ